MLRLPLAPVRRLLLGTGLQVVVVCMLPKYMSRRREDGLQLLRSPQDARRSMGRGGVAYLNRWDLVWVKQIHFGK